MSICDHELPLPLLHGQNPSAPGVSYVQAACLSINYVIGTGVFTLPLGFIQAGVGYGTILLLLSALCSYVSLTYIIETISRCEAITRDRDGAGIPDYRLSSKPWHYANMSSLILSVTSTQLIQFLLAVFCYGALWSFSSVFSSSLANIFFELVFNESCDIYDNPSSSCSAGYRLSLVVFGFMVVTLSLLDIKEQISIQIGLTIYRFVAFAIMLLTVLYSMYLAPPSWIDAESGPPYISPISKWNWSGYTILTSSAMALTMHINFPDVVQSMERRDPRPMRFMTISVYFLVTSVYLIIGLTCALFFGAKSEPLITLNWRSYTGPSFGVGVPSRYAIVLRTIVVGFPIFDMLSVFPLGALTLSSNLRKTYLSCLNHRLSQKQIKTCSRLLASIPPLLFAALASDLETIFSVVGLIAFFLAFFVPCCLALYSRRQCIERFGIDSKSPFNTVFSTSGCTGAVMLFSIVCTSLSVSTMVFK